VVIDDDPSAVELIATHLRQSGAIVLRAHGGAEGIELARRYRQDLIALDLEMPDVNGFDVVDALSGNAATAHIPIVIVTAQQPTPDMRRRLNGHIHDIVDKVGLNGSRFLGEVRRALAAHKVEKASAQALLALPALGRLVIQTGAPRGGAGGAVHSACRAGIVGPSPTMPA
jgi:CheY-like chemotaxis protein